jgi:hypothetical protein
MRWPCSKITQAAIALALGITAGASEFARFAMKSFDNYYFGPHKAFPYPYADAHSANLALARNCSLAFGLVFAGTFALQRLITNRNPK